MLEQIPLKYQRIVNEFIKISSKFEDIYIEQKKFYYPDQISLLILLSFFGEQILEDIDTYDISTKVRLFFYIETLINDNDEYLSTAVATGLCEVFSNYAIKNSNKSKTWEDKILPFLGKNTKKYIIDWINQ